MKSIYQLAEELARHVEQCMQCSMSSRDITEKTRHFIANNCLTKSGKRRYPLKNFETLSVVGHTTKNLLEDKYICFGYWYEGEFYTTRKGIKHKTTKILHNKQLPMETWDSLERGLYYIENLKLYY